MVEEGCNRQQDRTPTASKAVKVGRQYRPTSELVI